MTLVRRGVAPKGVSAASPLAAVVGRLDSLPVAAAPSGGGGGLFRRPSRDASGPRSMPVDERPFKGSNSGTPLRHRRWGGEVFNCFSCPYLFIVLSATPLRHRRWRRASSRAGTGHRRELEPLPPAHRRRLCIRRRSRRTVSVYVSSPFIVLVIVFDGAQLFVTVFVLVVVLDAAGRRGRPRAVLVPCGTRLQGPRRGGIACQSPPSRIRSELRDTRAAAAGRKRWGRAMGAV